MLQKYALFFSRGRGYKNKYICNTFMSYMSMHPYHSYHDIVINSDIELHRQDEELFIYVYYYETDSAEKIINQNIDYYKSSDNGNNWMKINPETDSIHLSEQTLIFSLHLQ